MASTNTSNEHDLERYSARQDVKMKMGGFVGEAEYRGEISAFVPLLRLGEKLRVGKATGFGLGRYEIL
jgi:CRISPR/Cas system endoribonuclease Cas6 (RAMP superfamily)